MRLGLSIFLSCILSASPLLAQEKITYQQHVRPIFNASCVSCHFDFGRRANFRHDTWGTLVRPANLTAGAYRGGRRPMDIYFRIHSGINGAGMPRFGSKEKGLAPNQIWDVVNFVQVLPYPQMREKMGIKID